MSRGRSARTTGSDVSGSTQDDRGDKVNPHGEQNETAAEINAKEMAYSVSPEMHVSVCDPGGDIDPSQRLHGDAGPKQSH